MQAPGHTTELPTKKTLGLVIVNVGHRWQGKLARAGDLSTPAADMKKSPVPKSPSHLILLPYAY